MTSTTVCFTLFGDAGELHLSYPSSSSYFGALLPLDVLCWLMASPPAWNVADSESTVLKRTAEKQPQTDIARAVVGSGTN